MALLLAFDTATAHCAVALSKDGLLLAGRTDDSERFTHAEKLNVFIDEVMREAGMALRDLDAVAVGIGPGSYTGLRIGLSAAKGLCFALDRPIIGLSTLSVLSAEVAPQLPPSDAAVVLHPMVDARRMEVFTTPLSAQGGPPEAVVLSRSWFEALSPGQHIVFGDGADKAVELFDGVAHVRHVASIKPSLTGLAASSYEAFHAARFNDLALLAPEYVKSANVTKAG